MKNIITTTTDLKTEYEIIGPVYFHISNHGFFTSQLSKLIKKYEDTLENNMEKDWASMYAKHSLEQDNRFDKAFYVGLRELQETAAQLGADAIVGFKHTIHLDPVGFQHFYMQFYGTAVKFKSEKY